MPAATSQARDGFGISLQRRTLRDMTDTGRPADVAAGDADPDRFSELPERVKPEDTPTC